jgi:ABC-type multidrug transport system ATPase subunit
MQINIENLGKRFNREWIFREINYQFDSHQSYAILGANGSGKSTLLHTIAGIMPMSEGKIYYTFQGKKIENNQLFKHLTWVAPYIELIEEFTLSEFLNWHHQLKPLQFSPKEISQKIGLEKSFNKEIKNFSSGMKQRVKLSTALYGNTNILLLDEPTSNLDQQGIDWYKENIKTLHQKKLIIIGSNQKEEYDFCENTLLLHDYK